MKLIPFTYTNDYDKRSTVHVNPEFVVSLRPSMDGDDQTIIAFDNGQVTVDGAIELVSAQLCGDDQPEESTAALDKMPDSG